MHVHNDTNAIRIALNGDWQQWPQGSSVADVVLSEAGDVPVAVALNQQVLPKRLWSSTALQQHDQLMIFQLVAGG